MIMNYYVYIYRNPIDNNIFYVGKGKENRAFSHLNRRILNLSIHNNDFSNKIDEILASNMRPHVEIIKYFNEENDAFNYESNLIREIGLDNLTNKTDIAWPCKLTPDMLMRRAQSCKNNLQWRATMQSEAHRQNLSRAVKKAIKDRGGRAPLSPEHRAAVSRGLKGKQIGTKNPMSKNTPEQIYSYLEEVMRGRHWRLVAKEMNIANAFNIMHRRAWTHVNAPPGYQPPRKKIVNEDTVKIVIEMYKFGHSKKKISEFIGFTPTTVSNILKMSNIVDDRRK